MRLSPLPSLPRMTEEREYSDVRRSAKRIDRHEHTDHRPSRRVDAGSERHRHDLLSARRAERCVLRRPVRPHQRHQADPCPPRAGLRLHGAGLRHGDGQAVGLCRRAGPGLPQHHGGAVDGLCRERAGAGADRPDPAGHDRPQCRAAARAARPARDHARPHQVGRPHQRARRGARPGQRSLPPPAVRAAASGGAGMRDGHLGAQGAGRAHSHAGQGRPLPRRRGRGRARRQASGQRAAPVDRGRRRRAGRGRAHRAHRRDAGRAGHDRPHGPGRDRRPPSPVGHHARRLPVLGRGRRGAGRGHAPFRRSSRTGASTTS